MGCSIRAYRYPQPGQQMCGRIEVSEGVNVDGFFGGQLKEPYRRDHSRAMRFNLLDSRSDYSSRLPELRRQLLSVYTSLEQRDRLSITNGPPQMTIVDNRNHRTPADSNRFNRLGQAMRCDQRGGGLECDDNVICIRTQLAKTRQVSDHLGVKCLFGRCPVGLKNHLRSETSGDEGDLMIIGDDNHSL